MSKIIEFSFPTVWDGVLQALAIFLIIFILYKLLFKPVMEFLEKRQAFIAGELKDAEAAKHDAHGLKKNYEAKLLHINDEADTILKEARQKAVQREESIIAAAKEEAESIKTKAMQDIALEEQRVRAEMKEEMIQIAGLMASKFVETSMDTDKQEKLVDETIKEMGDVQWLN